MGAVCVSHDLGVLAQLCDKLAVMYAGRIVEFGETGRVLAEPVGHRERSTPCNNMDEAFNNWLKTPKADGGAGLAPGTPLDKTTYNMLMREYVKADSNFQPSIVTVTNPTTQMPEQAFMSSPNSAQLMRDTQPRVQYKPDKEGNLLAIEGTLANYVTNNTGERIKIDPKSNALADALAIFECSRESVQDAGDHAILLGRVLRFAQHDGAGAPLVYFQGRYGALAQS
jgi:hypothetical protein